MARTVGSVGSARGFRHVSGPGGSRSVAHRALKRVYFSVKHFPDRVFRRRRHLQARTRLLGLLPVRSILVVCHGNICRSPYLEVVLRRSLPGANVISAGLVGPGRPVPKNSLTLAAERGLDLSTFRSRPVSRVNAREMDLVIVMDRDQARYVANVIGVSAWRIIIAGDLDPEASATRAIDDPWQQSIDVFRESFDRLDRCAAVISALISQPRQDPSQPLKSTRSAAVVQKALT